MDNNLKELFYLFGQKDKNIPIIIYAPGCQYVDHVDNQNFYGDACPKKKPRPNPKTLPAPPYVGREKCTGDLPELLRTDNAMALWKKAQDAGYVDANYQPLISRSRQPSLPLKWPKGLTSMKNGRYMKLYGTDATCTAITTMV